MKYAFMSFSTPQLSLSEMLAVAQQYGYDGVEPRMDARHGHGIEVDTTAAQRAALKAQAAASPVALACLATSLRYADPATQPQAVEQTHARIDLAGDLGIPAMRIFGGIFPETVSREQAIDLVVDALRAVADHAGERAVALCLETHDAWTDPQHVAEVLMRVNHPAIACNWDIMHPVRQSGVSIEQSCNTLKPWIRHLHVHDGIWDPLQLVPIGAGGIDHKTAIALLCAGNYDGYISGEWIDWADPYTVHLPREVATLREYEAACR